MLLVPTGHLKGQRGRTLPLTKGTGSVMSQAGGRRKSGFTVKVLIINLEYLRLLGGGSDNHFLRSISSLQR